MAYFAVSYQLNKDKDYQKLWDELKRLNGFRVMKSFWFLDLNSWTTKKVRDHLVNNFLDDDDAVCVVQMESRPHHYRGYKGTTDWVNKRFN